MVPVLYIFCNIKTPIIETQNKIFHGTVFWTLNRYLFSKLSKFNFFLQKLSPQDTLLQEFNPDERLTLLRVPAANNLEDLKLFVKVCRYFNGKYHLVIILNFN